MEELKTPGRGIERKQVEYNTRNTSRWRHQPGEDSVFSLGEPAVRGQLWATSNIAAVLRKVTH